MIILSIDKIKKHSYTYYGTHKLYRLLTRVDSWLLSAQVRGGRLQGLEGFELELGVMIHLLETL